MQLPELRKFTADNEDCPNNMFRVLGIYSSEITHKKRIVEIKPDGSEVLKRRVNIGMLA